LNLDDCLTKLSVTRTSVPGMAPIHFPPRSRLLPIPRRLRAHTYAIPILADRTLPLPLLVVLPLITFSLPLYYICLPVKARNDEWVGARPDVSSTVLLWMRDIARPKGIATEKRFLYGRGESWTGLRSG
jgi:hypothetical protein